MEAAEIFKNAIDPNPLLSHRFSVTFLTGGILPNPIDFRFQKVSGLNTQVQLETISEGGQNLHTHHLPKGMSYGNLVLERGYTGGLKIPSLLTLEFINTFARFKFTPSNVLVTVYGDVLGVIVPVGSWLFTNAYPVKWSFSELDAQSNTVLVDTMELAYSRFQTITI